MPAAHGGSGDPKGDLERADELVVQGARPRSGLDLAPRREGRHPSDPERATAEAVAEHERALALDPSNVDAAPNLGMRPPIARAISTKGLEYFDKGDLGRARDDPGLASFYGGKAWANFGLKEL